MNNYAIVIDNLVKYYGSRCVLDGINLKIPKGCIFGLLGRNGIGKTTLIRILLGLENPSRGQTSILGQQSTILTPQVRGKIGYVAEGHNLIQKYKVSRLVSLCKNLSKKWDDKCFSDLIDMFRLPMDRKVKELSTGMRAELNLALAMAIDPEVLILDDPTLGLDTVARRQFLELAVDVIQKEGRTILFSSHILSDVERIADRVGILAGTKLIVDCGLENLKARVQKLRIIFPEDAPCDLHLTEVIRQRNRGREISLTVANWNKQKQAVIESFGPEVCEQVPMSLEDLFVECTDLRELAVGD